MIAAALRALLVCPVCKSDLEDKNDFLVCRPCSVGYPIVGAVPVMLPEKAQKLAFRAK